MNEQNSANQYFLSADQNKNEYQLFIPTYIHAKLVSLNKIDIENLTTQIRMSLRLVIFTKQLPEFILSRLNNQIKLLFWNDDILVLDQQQDIQIIRQEFVSQRRSKENQNVGVQDQKIGIQFVVRKKLTTRLDPYVVFSPYQTIDNVLSIIIKKIKISYPEEHFSFNIRFNFMNNQYQRQQIKNKKENEKIFLTKLQNKSNSRFGTYCIAQQRMKVEFKESRHYPKRLHRFDSEKNNFYACIQDYSQKWLEQEKINENPLSSLQSQRAIQSQSKLAKFKTLKPFNQVIYHIPLFKRPIVSLVTIYMPILLLSLFNIFIFFSKMQLSRALNNAASLMIAYIEFIPILRSQMPLTPQLTLIQFFTYLQAFGTLVFVINSLVYRENDNSKHLQPQKYYPGFFYLAVFFTSIFFIFPLLMYLKNRRINRLNTKRFSQRAPKKNDYEKYWNKNEQANQIFSSHSSLIKGTDPNFKQKLLEIEQKYNEAFERNCEQNEKKKLLRNYEAQLISKYS